MVYIMCRFVLQCVAVCCSVLQCVVVHLLIWMLVWMKGLRESTFHIDVDINPLFWK